MVWGTSCHTLDWASFKWHSAWSNTLDHVQQCVHLLMAAFTMMTFHVTKLSQLRHCAEIPSIFTKSLCDAAIEIWTKVFDISSNLIILWHYELRHCTKQSGRWVKFGESGDPCQISLVRKSQRFDSVLDFPWEECFIQIGNLALEIKTVCLFVVVFLHHIVTLFLLSSIDYKLYTRWLYLL